MSQLAFKRPLLDGEARTPDQVVEHYEIEVELADRLRNSRPDERDALYSEVYDELFRRVLHHPQLTGAASSGDRTEQARVQLGFLERHVAPDEHLLEIGAGDCELSVLAGAHCARVTAIDVSSVVSDRADWPANVHFELCHGTDIPLPAESVDVAYSDQLMEHLHPEDAENQIRNIFAALKPGGRYVCITPNQVAGPWDISVYFDEAARGLHLKEYRAGEIASLLKSAGFSRVDFYAGGRGAYARVPAALVKLLESLLRVLPYGLRSRVARLLPVRGVLGLRVVAHKD